MSINHIWGKIKGYTALLGRNDIFTVIIIILSGISCFYLGMMHERDRNKPEITITNSEPSKESTAAVFNSTPKQNIQKTTNNTIKNPVSIYEGAYVASKNSTKFHLPWCPGAKQISEANKIWFKTKEEALARGYTPASNCKGI